jgi:transcription-repair coupling factor (superfamily II helicase)
VPPDKSGQEAAELGFPTRAPEPIERDIRRLRRLVRDGMPTVILCDNAGQAERLDELLNEDERSPSPAALTIGVLGGGFVVPPGSGPAGAGLRVLTDHEIFRRERRIRRARKYSAGTALDAAAALKPGDFVVHLEHGVGIYRGIETKFVGTGTIEVAVIEYEGGDKLNVPLYRLDQVERYRAAGEADDGDTPPPRLHKLGGRRWSQQREKTRAAIQEMTVELLDLYARRKVAGRPPHLPDTAWQRQLESSFLFEDTPDQRKATTDVKGDMEGGRPMDRLLVGDVGYGKTEIAVRAAFKAVQSGRQVAVLVPTTILADQHYRTFSDRFADFPVRVELMSRFQTHRSRRTMKALAEKKVDVVIGTHRLLSPDVAFRRPRPHRRRRGAPLRRQAQGAPQAARLETDVLTLTATPIPRTLHQSLAGLRDMTLMQTPPRDRSPVLTVRRAHDGRRAARGGVARELDRGGQVFFVHNRIETIEAVADHVRRVAARPRRGGPRADEGARPRGGDAPLRPRRGRRARLDAHRRDRARRAQREHHVRQQRPPLRPRAALPAPRPRGRSHRRAYCYLMVPDGIDEDAERRLAVLEHHTELGAGYRVRLKDMELRGPATCWGPSRAASCTRWASTCTCACSTRRCAASPTATPRPSPRRPTSRSTRPRTSPTTTWRAPRPSSTSTAGSAPPRPPRKSTPSATRSATASARRRRGRGLLRGGVPASDRRRPGGRRRARARRRGRVTFRDSAVPRMKALGAAFHGVQFQAEVKRAQPLSLKLTRLGGAALLPGLVRALRGLVA